MQCYKLLEELQSVIAEKFVNNFHLKDIYKATLYTFLYISVEKVIGKCDVIASFRNKIPPPLPGIAINELSRRVSALLECLGNVLSSKRPVIVEDMADLKYIVSLVKREVKSVDSVIVYDCMSLVEQLTVSAFLRRSGVRAFFLSEVFVNPLGLTRFLVQQLREMGQGDTLLELAKYLAKELNAKSYRAVPAIDRAVHEAGALGVEEFAERVSIDSIAYDVLEAARRGSLLLVSDHGYDVVAPPDLGYLYVTHGFRRESPKAVPVLILSKLTAFLGTR